jgi:hypothetical protein
VKWFSWSALVYLLSLLFIWSCGYWLLLQSTSWHLQQQQTAMTQQLEKAVSLLQNWQQGYQLHLAYLQVDAEPSTSQIESTPLADPLQEIDDSIRRVLWPDPLLAYAVLDQDNRVLRFSSAAANNFFTQTQLPVAPEQVFLPPLVFPTQWVLPLRVRQSGQTLLLWLDAARLQRQLQQLTLSFNHATEFLLLDPQAQMFAHSRYQIPLLARLGLSNTDPLKALQLYAKRPPENLLHSKQRYLDAGVWPLTTVVNELNQRQHGFLASHYPNYLGRPSLAAWQYLSEWQLYAVIERDATLLLADLAKIKQQLVLLLSALSVLLTLIFWWLHRRMQVAISAQPEESDWQPSEIEDAGLSIGASGEAETPLLRSDPAAAVLLEAWAKQTGADPRLADLSRHWLQRQQTVPLPDSWVCPIGAVFTQWLQQWQSQHELQLCCILDSSLPKLVQFEQQKWLLTLQILLDAYVSRAQLNALQLTLSLDAAAQLQLELIDRVSSETDADWQSWLDAAVGQNEPLVASTQSMATIDWFRQLAPLLQATGGQLALEVMPDGHCLRWTTAVTLPEFQPVQGMSTVTGRALLLCPAGWVQQNYQQLFQQAGLELLPLDDSHQLMMWCAGTPLPLDKLLIDEVFVKSDPHLALKVAQVVRRYFPQVQVLVAVSKPERWLQLQHDVVLLPKPCTWLVLQQAFLQQQGLVKLPRLKVWVYLPDPLELWWLEQMCQQLDIVVASIQNWPQLPGDLQQDGYCLPWELQHELVGPVLPARLLWCVSAQHQSAEDPADSWHLAAGPAPLSEKIYQWLLLPTAEPELPPLQQALSIMDETNESTPSRV